MSSHTNLNNIKVSDNETISTEKIVSVKIVAKSLIFIDYKQLFRSEATIECGFTLKHVRDMIRTYSLMHHADKYSKNCTCKNP